MKTHQIWTLFAIGGIILLLASISLYLYYGYHSTITNLWILSMVSIGVYFFKISPKEEVKSSTITRIDLIFVTLIMTIICTAYLSVDPGCPPTLIGDEVNTVVKSAVFSRPGFDIFRPSDFLNLPAPVFSITGHLAQSFGLIDILNVRLIHTILTIGSILIAYFLFRRIFSSIFLATTATLLLAGAHSLFAISHLSHLTNSALLIQIVSLLLLLIGLQQKSFLYAFLGGISAGFGWVVYSPAKIIIFSWLISLAIVAILLKLSKLSDKVNIKHTLPATLIGFIMAVCPFIIGSLVLIQPQEEPRWDGYLKKQILLTPEGQAEQKDWIQADTWGDSMKHNIINGLTTFNSKAEDKGRVYNLYGKHGFVDPITGIFLWIGVLSILLTIHRRKIETVIILIHFLFLLFVFSFLVNRAPHYTRLIIMLPAAIPLVVIGIFDTAKLLALSIPWTQHRRMIQKICVVVASISILTLNILTFSDYLTTENNIKDPICNAMSYIHNQSDQGPKHFYTTYGKDSERHLRVWNTQDWQHLWLNLMIVHNKSFENLSIQGYLATAENGGWPYYGKHREPISNAVYYIIEKISKAPHHFYLIKGADWNTHPQEFENNYDWKIWLNLFTVFKQPLEILEGEKFLAGNYNLPATFFTSSQTWENLRNQIPVNNQTTNITYLSSRKNLLVVEILPIKIEK